MPSIITSRNSKNTLANYVSLFIQSYMKFWEENSDQCDVRAYMLHYKIKLASVAVYKMDK
jgi:hypothetical protein